ncbi:UvrD-helicase domain-containing protein [Staphylococcus coagulans]|uniref:UvrD-helicase domain-containing protein n=1 Tax=Staphylococcus coagulans TaxID=74706 RepID=UPI001F4BE337|nr:ATP-dependent helicase [Staphylococcus coagulans]UNB46779.1 ATP-dependent helicase [Staphylococcus coagulans]
MHNNLNTFQLAAINEEKNALVLACPGSGKTLVLTLKIAKELEKLTKRTDRIVALTFTNRAADEIDRRINTMGIDISQLWTGTIHSFCLQWIIKPYGIYLFELQKSYTILDEFKAMELKDNFKSKFGIPKYDDFLTRRDKNGNYVNMTEKYNNAAKSYHKHLLENNLIDFDLILYFSYYLITKYSQIANNLARLLKYFFIDEFQDTQDLQYAIVGEIIKASSGDCKIFLVGDPDQAIFNSLGGVVKTPSEISKDIGGYTIKQLGLSNNYRSTERLIKLYSKFQSTSLVIKSQADYRDEQGIIFFDKSIHKDDLVNSITEIIKEEIAKGVPPNDICILAPQWSFLTSIARKLRANLPDLDFDSPGLTLLPRNKDNFWFKLARLILISKDASMYLVRLKWAKELLEELTIITSIPTVIDNNSCRILLKKINSIHVCNEDAIKYLEKSFKYFFEIIDFEYSSSDLLKEQWDSFFNGIQRRYLNPDFKNVPKDINYMKKMFNSKEGIVVNTCQGVKGEEFHTVIAFGLLRGYLPHWNQIINQPINKEIIESNKLLYVLCSRAKKNIYLFSETGRKTAKGVHYKVNNELNAIDFNKI